MKTLSKIVAAALLLGAAAPTLAHHDRHVPGERFEQRIAEQDRRIQRAYDTGELTGWEYKRMRREQRELRKRLSLYRSDSHISRKERHKLRRALSDDRELLSQLTHNHARRDMPRGHRKPGRGHGHGHGHGHKHDYRHSYRHHDHHRRGHGRHHWGDGNFFLFGFEL